MASTVTREDAEKYFQWLDELRASTKVNMFAARPSLAGEFNLDYGTSRDVWSAWSATFSEALTMAERTEAAYKQGLLYE